MARSAKAAAVFVSILLVAPLPASALPLRVGPVQAELLSEPASIQPGVTFTLGVRLLSDPDWHVYWKNPGGSGLPTTLAWSLPPGFVAGPIQWPVPQRIESLGDVTFGYPGETVLLVDVTPPSTIWQKQVTLAVTATWLACRIECTPGKASLAVTVPVGTGPGAPDAATRETFRNARSRLPQQVSADQLRARIGTQRIELIARGLQLAADSRVAFYPASAGTIDLKAPQPFQRSGSDVTLTLARDRGGQAPQRLQGLLVILDRGSTRGLDVDLPLGPAPASGTDMGLLLALLLALVGGFILNLMPCVLPVVSLKVLGLVGHSRTGRLDSLRGGLLFAAGVLLSFWAIVGVLLGLRAGGQLLGWGFQFQDPIVVAITAVLFFLIGANLFGLFELRTFLPRAASGGRAMGSFGSGLLATAVATPCTAPFMGAALGYALGQPPVAAFGVFTALGVGMAAPYVLFCVVPGLVEKLPKPGPWMETLKQVLGFPMMAAVIWMLFVLSALSGPGSVIALLATLLACGLGAWIWGRWGRLDRSRTSRAVALVAGLALVLGSTAWAVAFLGNGPRAEPGASSVGAAASSSEPWQPWSPQREAELRSAGSAVFVDFSARWCLSCQVNERVALNNPAVLKRFRQLGVATLRADWTDHDPRVEQALAAFGRASVPLYVLYPAGGAEPVLLPELLTPGIVLAALERAR